MCDYPYPTDFLAPLPAFPVQEACSSILAGSDRLAGLASAAGLFFNGTQGHLPCFDIYAEYVECADPTGCGTGPDGVAWDIQVCTEIVYAPDTNNVTDMFPPRTWNTKLLSDYCKRTYNITPRPLWMLTAFGGGNISSSVTNIIFSNGMLDPWRAGGFLESLSPTLPAVLIAVGLKASLPCHDKLSLFFFLFLFFSFFFFSFFFFWEGGDTRFPYVSFPCSLSFSPLPFSLLHLSPHTYVMYIRFQCLGRGTPSGSEER